MKPTFHKDEYSRSAVFSSNAKTVMVYQYTDFTEQQILEAPQIIHPSGACTWQELTPFFKAFTAAYKLAYKWDYDTGKPMPKGKAK